MNKKINISIIGTRGYPYVYSGYETFVKQLSERLVLKDCNVTVYCHKGLFKIRQKEIKGIKLVYVPTIETKILSQPIHSFLSIIHACFSNTDVVLVVNSANGPFGLLTKLFRIPTAINVDGLEWLRPKWKGLGSIYFKCASKMATLFYDQIINDSDEMRKVYLDLFKRDSKVIAYGANIRKSKNPDLLVCKYLFLHLCCRRCCKYFLRIQLDTSVSDWCQITQITGKIGNSTQPSSPHHQL